MRSKRQIRSGGIALLAMALLASAGMAQKVDPVKAKGPRGRQARAKNLIFFLGDGMNVATVTATRVFSVGVDGKLVMDQFPFTALAKTATADHITTDSAAAMSALVTGVSTNSGIISMDAKTERGDFNKDGDGRAPYTLWELAKKAGKATGVITTTRLTHATPAACFAHINERNAEDAIALQALPGDPTYNRRLGKGLDLLAGGGRRNFVPNGVVDEEGDKGRRADGRDLRKEFSAAGYSYVWNRGAWNALKPKDLPVLALFESSHMEYEWDRPYDIGREPSLAEMTGKAVELLRKNKKGFVLMVEGGRIDHAHHECNAFRAITDTEVFDEAIMAAIKGVDLRDTLIVVTSDHGHVFNIGGYPLRPYQELPYAVGSAPADYKAAPFSGILNVVYDLSIAYDLGGSVVSAGDSNSVPYTVLSYGNGPGFRSSRIDPLIDPTPGFGGLVPQGPNDPAYRQEAGRSPRVRHPQRRGSAGLCRRCRLEPFPWHHLEPRRLLPVQEGPRLLRPDSLAIFTEGRNRRPGAGLSPPSRREPGGSHEPVARTLRPIRWHDHRRVDLHFFWFGGALGPGPGKRESSHQDRCRSPLRHRVSTHRGPAAKGGRNRPGWTVSLRPGPR